ncbi:MAG: hypothetical protein ACTSPM_04770 [Candidatus Heimdallarchaeota archaeon]
MSEANLVNKIACDKQSKKLGKIVDVRGSEERVLIQDKPHIVILVKTVFWKKNIKISIEAKKILRIEGKNVLLNTTKSEFSKMVKIFLAERRRLAKAAKLSEASQGSQAAALVFRWRGG